MPDARLGAAALALGISLASVFAVTRVLAAVASHRDRRAIKGLARLFSNEPEPVFATTAAGELTYCNPAARKRFGDGTAGLLRELGDLFAVPQATFRHLIDRALASGSGREDVVARAGQTRLSVHRIGGDAFLWRLTELPSVPVERANDLFHLPMLKATPAGSITAMNEALRQRVGSGVTSLDRLFTDLPLRPGELHDITGLRGRERVRVAMIGGAGSETEIYLMPADPAPAGDWDLLDALPVPLLKISARGAVLLANRPARHLLGMTSVAGDAFSGFVEGLGRSVTDWIAEAAEGRTVMKPEIMRATRARNETYLQVTLNRVKEGDGFALIAVLNDATELKTLEAQFVQSQKMQAIGQLAGGVAHDFNNLLTAISGHCDLLLLRHEDGDPDYSDLTQIHQNANRAASLVGQLLAFSRKQTLKPEVVDLREALSDLAHLLNRLVGEKVSLTLYHDPNLRPIRADKRQIEQVIMNLVVNARDAMPEGGEIRIDTRTETLTEPYQRDRATVPAGEYTVVTVSDRGKGIPADKLQKIFEPFYTTKRTGEGTGLGLSTAYGIVKQTGGFIFVDSIVGQGAAFQIYLPAPDIVDEPPLVAPQAISAGASVTASGTVLLVEDEAPVRAFASRALKMRGYTVIEAENGEDALAILGDPGVQVDVFVTDVIMPGLDGPSWVARALEARRGVKVVFVSGYAEENFAQQQAAIPNSVFLPKPFSLSELTETVRRQIC